MESSSAIESPTSYVRVTSFDLPEDCACLKFLHIWMSRVPYRKETLYVATNEELYEVQKVLIAYEGASNTKLGIGYLVVQSKNTFTRRPLLEFWSLQFLGNVEACFQDVTSGQVLVGPFPDRDSGIKECKRLLESHTLVSTGKLNTLLYRKPVTVARSPPPFTNDFFYTPYWRADVPDFLYQRHPRVARPVANFDPISQPELTWNVWHDELKIAIQKIADLHLEICERIQLQGKEISDLTAGRYMKEVQAVIKIKGVAESRDSAFACIYAVHALLSFYDLENIDVIITEQDLPCA